MIIDQGSRGRQRREIQRILVFGIVDIDLGYLVPQVSFRTRTYFFSEAPLYIHTQDQRDSKFVCIHELLWMTGDSSCRRKGIEHL